jgi:signal transduction histidine kinase
MEYKQHLYQNNLGTVNGYNASPKVRGRSTILPSTGEASGNHFMMELQKMEEINAYLENLVKKQTKELSEVAAINTKFISIIAHDLRSPLNAILGILNVLKISLRNCDPNEIETHINIASTSAKKTLNLLESLLTWAISQNKNYSFNPVKINLRKLLRDEIENIKISAKQKQITLNHSISPNLNVNADPQMVKSILRNLISNAIKYTNTGGEITVSASENEPFIEIVIRDNGIGISFEAQKNLFKIYGLHSKVGTHHEKGAGLGLLLCKEFVERHCGDIQIKSEPGKGSEFKFTLPQYYYHPPNDFAENV